MLHWKAKVSFVATVLVTLAAFYGGVRGWHW